MLVKESLYIKENKALFKALLEALLEKYEYASLLATDCSGRSYRVSKSGKNIGESSMLTSQGFVIKVYDKGSYVEYSGNTLTEADIPGIVATVSNELFNICNDSEKHVYKVPEDEPVSFSKSTECEIDPVSMGDKAIIDYLTGIYEKGMGSDEKVLNCIANAAYSKISKLFLSRNKDLEQNTMWTQGSVIVDTIRGEEVKTAYNSCSNLGGMELLSRLEELLPVAVKTAVELLDSEPITPGEYECICTPETTGMIVHEAFGHGVEMDMFVKDRALARQYVGEYVASPLITMHDGNAIDQTATYFFDDEGTLSHDTVIIDKGILVTGISDLQSAMVLGTEPTGNGRRESYKRKSYTRMTNTYFEAGNDSLEDMIASVKYGFMLENPSSGMEDPKNWGIQCMVTLAREIKDGKFTGKIFSPIVLTGYVPDLLKSISMVSREAKYNGSGYCGKGYKEWVKVSDGGPYIKAKIRLG